MSWTHHEGEWVCDMCGATLWVNAGVDGQFYLMRIGEIEQNECIQCKTCIEVVQ